jgi:hypothetical protein
VEEEVLVREGGIALTPVVVAVPGPPLAHGQEVHTLGPTDPPHGLQHGIVPLLVRVEVGVPVAVHPPESPQRDPGLEGHPGLHPGPLGHLEGLELRDVVDPVMHLEGVGPGRQGQRERALFSGEDPGQVLVAAGHDLPPVVTHDHAGRERFTTCGVEDLTGQPMPGLDHVDLDARDHAGLGSPGRTRLDVGGHPGFGIARRMRIGVTGLSGSGDDGARPAGSLLR